MANDIKERQFSKFLAGYTVALLWSTSHDCAESGCRSLMDVDNDTSPEFEDACRAGCRAFFAANYPDLVEATSQPGYDWSRAGHDFALTRNRHGAGYWDGDLPRELGQRLTDAACAAGSVDAYIGDDGLIYSFGA